jgi:MFS transporter, FHS family, glucose/mannose:H+ symporter
MVIGLFGPSVPGMVEDLGISYGQAGMFFTAMAVGSLFGTGIAPILTDFGNRKRLYAIFALCLCLGLFAMGIASTYILILLVIFLFSLFGSPVGAVGQSIMLDMFPEHRTRNLALMTTFAAVGNFLAPLLVSANTFTGLNWRWPFMETGIISGVLFFVIIFMRIPEQKAKPGEIEKLKVIFSNRQVRLVAILVFLSVGIDVGFASWLAEYFKTELEVPLRLASLVVSVYVFGIILGRLSVAWLHKRFKGRQIVIFSLTTALAALLVFLNVDLISLKLVLVFIYGLGVAPIFPLLISFGTSSYPKQPGAVTGLLFACLALGGMVFPLAYGLLAERITIERSYYAVVVLAVVILIIALKERSFSDQK